MTKPIRVQISPLTERIYAGRINDTGDTWRGEKFDVTSDVFGAVIEKIKPGHKTIVTRQDGKQFEVEVREIGAAGVQEAPSEDAKAWEEGVLMAVSVLNSIHDQPGMAADVLNELNLNGADCSELDDFDKKNLRIIQTARQHMKLRGLDAAMAAATQTEKK